MIGNFEQSRVANPSVPFKQPTLIGDVYIKKHADTVLFRKAVTIKKGGFGRYYWMNKGVKLCPVHREGNKWVVSCT